MADVHRVGAFGSGGRFTVLLDLNDLTTISYVRDTFKVTPYQETALYPKASRRYGGSRQIGETHDNGTIEATWLLSSSTGDGTLAAWDDLAALLESPRSDLFYQWRPDGASRFTYFDLRGGSPWEPLYSWVQFAGARVLQVRGGWQVAPLALGDPMDIADDFSTDTVGGADADWSQDAGTGVAVSGGRLAATDTTVKALYHSARGYDYTDVEVTLKHTPGSGVTGYEAGPSLRRLDASNYLFATVTGTLLSIYKRDGGANTSLASVALGAALVAGSSYWLRLRSEGDVLYAEHFTAQPTPLSAPATSVSHTLTGANATKFGAGVGGDVGIGWWDPNSTSDRIDDFAALPFTYRRAATPTVAAGQFDLYGLPGTAPALVDIYSTNPSTVEPKSALIGWGELPAGGSALAPPTFYELGGTADAACSNGAYQPTSPAVLTFDATLVPADDFADTITVEVWAIFKTNGTGGGRAIAFGLTGDGPAVIYTPEYGTADHDFQTIASGRVITRLGTLTFPRGATAGAFSIRISWSGDIAGIDTALVVPARQRACTSTGHANADAQKWLAMSHAAEWTKVIRSDLSGGVMDAASTGTLPAPDIGLSGQLLEFPPGDVRTLHHLGLGPVDAPDAPGTEELVTSTVAVRYSVTPRFHLARSG